MPKVPNLLSPDERTLLQRVRSLDSNSVVRLRSALAWNVARFATVVVALQERGLLVREGTRLTVTAEGAGQLMRVSREHRAGHTTSFAEKSEVPRLPVGSLYLPDQGRFLRAVQRGLYTHAVSRTDPE
jgi:hypothetical protein